MDEVERRSGDKVPYEKGENYYYANRYFEWAAVQPEGADTSLDAYFEEGDEAYQEGLPADFNAEQQYGDTDPYDWYDQRRTKDDGYRFEHKDD